MARLGGGPPLAQSEQRLALQQSRSRVVDVLPVSLEAGRRDDRLLKSSCGVALLEGHSATPEADRRKPRCGAQGSKNRLGFCQRRASNGVVSQSRLCRRQIQEGARQIISRLELPTILDDLLGKVPRFCVTVERQITLHDMLPRHRRLE